METKAQNNTRTAVPNLTNAEYVSLLKKHYLHLLDSLDPNLKEVLKDKQEFELEAIPNDYQPKDKDSLSPYYVREFAMRIKMYSLCPFRPMLYSKEKIDAFFDSYETAILPKLIDDKTLPYDESPKYIAHELLSKEWDEDRKTAFSMKYLPDFLRMINTGDFDYWYQRFSNHEMNPLSFTDIKQHGYNPYPDVNIFFRVRADDSPMQEIKVHCEFRPTDPERYEEVGHYGYCSSNDFYFIDSISVTGPMDICWDENLKNDQNCLYFFMTQAVERIGGIRI